MCYLIGGVHPRKNFVRDLNRLICCYHSCSTISYLMNPPIIVLSFTSSEVLTHNAEIFGVSCICILSNLESKSYWSHFSLTGISSSTSYWLQIAWSKYSTISYVNVIKQFGRVWVFRKSLPFCSSVLECCKVRTSWSYSRRWPESISALVIQNQRGSIYSITV